MRKSFDSLSDLVRIDLTMDPFQGDVFIFVGKDRTRAKVLIWESTGFWLCAKRLESACFRLPAPVVAEGPSAATMPLSNVQVTALLEEVAPRVLRHVRTESR
jgi:transposase